MRILRIAGLTGLLSLTLTVPARAAGVVEQWSGPYTAQISVAAGDVNGDGLDDIVSFNTFNWTNKVLLSTGTGFLPQQNWGGANMTFNGTGFRGNANLVGDMDGDGRADALIVRLSSPRGIFVARSMVNSFGVNTFDNAAWWLNNTIAGDYGTMTADLDADGDDDVVGLFGGVAALAARSNGTASLPLTAWGPPLRGDKASLVADATGDGAADFILVDTTGVRVVPANPRWWDAPAQWTTTPFYGTRRTLAADMDADGRADLVAINNTDVQIMRSTGTGYSAPEQWHPTAFYGTKDTLVADVTGDGAADLVAVNDNTVMVLRTL
jgi:FG-GAP-like repeat